ncbi:MAG: sulfotransferase domain-containing protein [Phormidesmis sp.]
MSYQAYNVARLHARDLVFRLKSAQRNLLSGGRRCQPLIICNSYPKSGTHLLYQILYSLPDAIKWNDIVSVQALCGTMNTADHLRWKIGAAPDGSIVRSHLMYSNEIRSILAAESCKQLFIYRDLRDVAVSHARWVLKEPQIFLHDIYSQMASFDEQLMSTIEGVPIGTPFGSNLSQPNIGQDFSRWAGWIQDPDTLAIRFEDLVGERGGGDEEKRLYIVSQILDHLEVSLSPAEIASQFSSNAMNPGESHTFVKGGKGKIGGWREFFTSAHKEAFKKVAGDRLIELGYESDLEW